MGLAGGGAGPPCLSRTCKSGAAAVIATPQNGNYR